MRLLTFSKEKQACLGMVMDDLVMDLSASYALLPSELRTLDSFPSDMRSFLEAGEEAMETARRLGEWARESGRAVTYRLEEVEIEAPILDPRKVICVGKLKEMACLSCGIEPSPLCDLSLLTAFSKFPQCIIGPLDPILRPRIWGIEAEGELAVIIGKMGKHIPQEEAFRHIAGYAPFIDVSTKSHAGHPFLHKCLDASGALGPYLVTADELDRPPELRVRMDINGWVCQSATTGELDFEIPYIISSLSHFMTLLPGDIIACGMLASQGASSGPCELRPGDRVTLEIEGLGKLSNPVLADL